MGSGIQGRSWRKCSGVIALLLMLLTLVSCADLVATAPTTELAQAATPTAQGTRIHRVTQTPQHAATRTPARRATRTPERRATRTPQRNATRTPAHRATPTIEQSDDGLPVVDVSTLPPEAQATVKLIERGGPFPYRQDGQTFGNREHHLPARPNGYYREYTVETPGSADRGARRIIGGKAGELYYTDDHYDSFVRVRTE